MLRCVTCILQLFSHRAYHRRVARKMPRITALFLSQIQNQRRSMKKNPSVKNRSGQPDTPHQRLGSYFIGAPGNSSSFYSYDNGDSDEENWGRGRAPRVGSSRAQMSDSRTSYMSEMARVPHVTDSQTSMLRKYSRTMGSARARKDVSFSSKQCFVHVSYSERLGIERNRTCVT